ncbi:hypothetical protein BGW37DRAFT_468044 [Umbelopsis sp. PMI_123]|nr:hypothetical protein BGW37DRAFT_468044 [Umbelopsis sp. PMI_123]
MNPLSEEEMPIQSTVPESFVQRSRARQEKLRQAAADRKARVNCDSDDSVDSRKETTRRSNIRESIRDTRRVQSSMIPSKMETTKTKTARSLKKSRSLPSAILKPKLESSPALPDSNVKVHHISTESLPEVQSLSIKVTEPYETDTRTQQRRSPHLTVNNQDNMGYDNIEEQLINIYGESKWVRSDRVSKTPSESASADTAKLKRMDTSLLSNPRPKIQYEHFLSSTLPLLHRFTYSQVNTLSRKESELIKQCQADVEPHPNTIRKYASNLEPILRQKIGLLIVLYESVRDVVSTTVEEELIDLECGEDNSKYSRWRDAGTGIQPFLPPVPPRSEMTVASAATNVFRLLVGPVLAIVRIAAVFLLLALYTLIISGIGGILSIAPPLQRTWNRVWMKILARIALFVIGFYYIRSEIVYVRRGRGHSASNQKQPSVSVGSGDVIIVNSSSYIDILYLTFRFAPLFTQIDATTNKVKFISTQEAIKQCGKYPELSLDTKTYSLKEASQLAKKQGLGPIVVFPEGTTSNGRALLKFIPLFKDFSLPEKEVKLHVLGLKYEYNHFSPTYTVGSKAVHFLKLCCQISNSLLVKCLAPNESPSSPSFSIANSISTSTAAAPTGASPNAATDSLANDGDSVGAQLLTLLGGITRLRKTSLGIRDKIEFLDYYLQRTGGVKPSGTKSKKTK